MIYIQMFHRKVSTFHQLSEGEGFPFLTLLYLKLLSFVFLLTLCHLMYCLLSLSALLTFSPLLLFSLSSPQCSQLYFPSSNSSRKPASGVITLRRNVSFQPSPSLPKASTEATDSETSVSSFSLSCSYNFLTAP